MSEGELLRAYDECERLTRRFSTSYSLAMRLFPKEVGRATTALYAFARTADNFVDQRNPDRDSLYLYRESWEKAWRGRGTDPVLRAAADVYHRYDIPFELSDEFFGAMEMDTHITRYETHSDLSGYMEGSAGAVGVMMAHVIGFRDPGAPYYARLLGHALQLTNFLRDIKEDYEQFGRIYIPLAELTRYGVTEEEIASGSSSLAFRYLMHAQVERARKLYQQGREGIPLLHQRGRAAVTLAAALYEQLLCEIELREYDVFSKRVTVSPWKKSVLALSAAGSAVLGRLPF